MSDVREAAVRAAHDAADQGLAPSRYLDQLAKTDANAGDAMIALRRAWGLDLTEAKAAVFEHPRWAWSPEQRESLEEAIDQVMDDLGGE